MNMPLIAGIEAGGTKFVLGIGRGDGGPMLARHTLPTVRNPADVLSETILWLQTQADRLGPLTAIGVASFGPVDLNMDSPTYGHITTTPKSGWQNTDLITPLRQAFGNMPIGFDTDVNAAALAEHRWGAARGLTDFVYLTMGTGIGGGGMAGGQMLHGMVHPEMGHLRIPRATGDTFSGVCPYHSDCWEGLCSGPAIRARTGVAAEDLPAEHPAWPLVVESTALAIANIAAILSPQRVILGGSIRKAGHFTEVRFFSLLRARVRAMLAAYIMTPAIVPPDLGDDAGVLGALALGADA